MVPDFDLSLFCTQSVHSTLLSENIGICRRRALHSYDPADLQTSLTEAMDEEKQRISSSGPGVKDVVSSLSVKDRELAKAKSMGLQLQFDTKPSPTSVTESNEMTELDKWESKRNIDDGFFSDQDISDDSDDDLL